MDTSDRNKKLLATILNKVFDIYNIREYRKYFIQLNLDIEGMTKSFIIYSDNKNKYSSNMYYHYYIYLSIMLDAMKEELPNLLDDD